VLRIFKDVLMFFLARNINVTSIKKPRKNPLILERLSKNRPQYATFLFLSLLEYLLEQHILVCHVHHDNLTRFKIIMKY
jgi:hypothetical protein